MSDRRGLITRYLLLSVLVAFGCRKQADPKVFATAEAAYNAAVDKMEKLDFSGAADDLTRAFEARGLNVDMYCDALVRRAQCFARLKRFDEALADVDRAAQGSPQMDEVHRTQAFVFKKQGKLAEAGAAMREARKLNASIKEIE